MPDQQEQQPEVNPQGQELYPSKTPSQAKPAPSILNKPNSSPVRSQITSENQIKRSNNLKLNTSGSSAGTSRTPDLITPTRPTAVPTQFPTTGGATVPGAGSAAAKYGSVSFTVPDQTEKSHRGSISARPSSVQISTLDQVQQTPKGAPGVSQQPLQQHPTTATTIKTPTSTVDPTNKTGSHINISRQPSITNSIPAISSSNPSISSISNASANSSRQNSNTNTDFIHFTANNFSNYHHYPQENIISAKSPESVSRTTSPTSQERVPTPPNTQLAAMAKKPKEKQTKAVIGTPTTQVPFYEFFQKQDDQKIHILIGATGSVATIKVPLIIDKLYKTFGAAKVSIQLVVTKSAEHFLKGLKLNSEVKIWRDEEEWFGYKKMGDPVLHTELRKWADILLISPLSANTLAKISNGICDNLLSAIVRSWNPATPILIAPAMNTFMYTHPVTKKHLNLIKEDCPWIEILKPVEKVLVCGDIGMGGMREWSDIVEILVKKLKEIQKARDIESKKDRLESLETGEKIKDQVDDEDDDDEDDEDEDEDEDEDDDEDDDSDDEDDEDECDEGDEGDVELLEEEPSRNNDTPISQ